MALCHCAMESGTQPHTWIKTLGQLHGLAKGKKNLVYNSISKTNSHYCIKLTTAYPNPIHILTGLKLLHGFIHILELDLKRSLLHKNLRLWLPRTSGSFLGQKQIFLPKFRNLFSISYGTSNLLYQIISENVQAIQIRLLKEYGY